jgi:hypothetical protein
VIPGRIAIGFSLVLLVGDHHDAFFALPSDELRPLRTRAAKEFAKTRLGNLELPTALGRRLLTPSATSYGFVFWHKIFPI